MNWTVTLVASDRMKKVCHANGISMTNATYRLGKITMYVAQKAHMVEIGRATDRPEGNAAIMQSLFRTTILAPVARRDGPTRP
jgi:hypothetical protein